VDSKQLIVNHDGVKRLLLGAILLALLVRGLPYLAPIRERALRQDDRAIEFCDRNHLPLGTLLTRDQEHTAVVPLAQVSPHFIQAIISAEDKRFWHRGPVDSAAIVRATLAALRSGRIVSGASTIPMQLARMVQPTPRTLAGKAGEIWTAWRLAAGMNHDAILAAYINRLPMGSNIYGVAAAADIYFGVPAADLSIAQASLLAALPNDPVNLDPYFHWEALKRRQAYVLNRMVEDGYLSPIQAERAATETISLQLRQQGIIAAPHFLFWLATQLPPEHPPRLYTTLDRPLQQFVETQVKQVVQSLASHHAQHAAALVLDNASGDVLAYVGSPSYFGGSGSNDGVQALRQPGSTLKPFLYELALDKRVIQPNTILADVPTHYPIPGAKLYSPIDYSETFHGPVRVRVALANSLNVPAVRVLEKVGIAPFLEYLHQLGFQHLTESPDYYGLGLALGSGEVSLWELANAYRALARQGQAGPARCQLDGTPCKADVDSQLPTEVTLSPHTQALIIDMLSDRHARAQSFGVDSVLSLPFPAAVKTGTSSDFRDTWTVGFSQDYTVATWVGNFSGEPMQQISGVMGAAPLWHRIIMHLHESQEPGPLPPLTGLVKQPICTLSGHKPTPACPTVVQEYFYPEELAAYEAHPDQAYQAVANPAGKSTTYSINLPVTYNAWLANQGADSPLPAHQLRILSPQANDYFLQDPAANPQRLAFKAALPADLPASQPIEWWLNGQRLATTTTDTWFWPLQQGRWTLEIKSGDQQDRIQFEVGAVEQSSTRRGFSVVPSTP
jgi:penicillin-binding protein 1C